MEQKELSEEEKVAAKKLEEFLTKRETKETIGALVVQFQEVFGFGWFTLEDCTKVFKSASIPQLVDIVNTLDLCGFLLANDKKEIIVGKENFTRYRLSNNAMARMTDVLGK